MRPSRARTTRTTGPPGAYAPPGDNALLPESLAGERPARGARPLDPSTGTGVLAIAAARRGARATAAPAAPRAGGPRARVVARCGRPFGRITTARAVRFERRGLVPPGGRTERLVVIRALRAPDARPAHPHQGHGAPARDARAGAAAALRPREAR
ncbi:hypothetical protein ACFC0K_25090 [Streptomyces hydrogenans]|uniref:hypothetical protein n=1 Tax=Streptomyces hydrogenans TaxID=1873719 RepID=UPI0035E2357D